jgi:hypothetical protein
VNVSTSTITGCAGLRDRTILSGVDRRNRTTLPGRHFDRVDRRRAIRVGLPVAMGGLA